MRIPSNCSQITISFLLLAVIITADYFIGPQLWDNSLELIKDLQGERMEKKQEKLQEVPSSEKADYLGDKMDRIESWSSQYDFCLGLFTFTAVWFAYAWLSQRSRCFYYLFVACCM